MSETAFFDTPTHFPTRSHTKLFAKCGDGSKNQCYNAIVKSKTKRRMVMKKVLILLLVFAMVFTFTACGKDEHEEPKNAEPKSTTYDTGEFTVSIPDGWYAIPCSDFWSEEEGAIDATALNICKGGSDDWDILTKPYIRIDYYDAETTMQKPDKEWYENGVDLEPFTTGKHTWEAFSATTMDCPIVILWAEEGADRYQIAIYVDQPDGKISIDDADVQAILASIELK